ncbi:TetR/AcrR family transcriptional regulator [Actinomycetospora endophytica]|uniref:TetR/AcrR family transcriptional regulator n=1 Tax=Actinomycetospora endophytica TaxID=2291215 RepID=A0ABS8PHB0_9PSEU|nr:TetR/AcrR family transcriptional regulator [Actinomycetospora endophytica]MCD2196374.1 TetR/AcrR family transcriptional regulator [Actinomycetospora endophytica]
MADDPAPPLRADARRNRDALLRAAAAGFAAGDDPTLEKIARDAGVGIGTLYRHFPTREVLVEAVYRTELTTLCESVHGLLREHEPADALRAWMDRYAEFVTTKRGMADTFRAMVADGTVAAAQTRESIDDAVGTILRAGAADGSLRADVEADDVVTVLVGVFVATGVSDDRARIGRLLDLVLGGLRPREH